MSFKKSLSLFFSCFYSNYPKRKNIIDNKKEPVLCYNMATKGGFTLIELLIVIAIIAILTTAVIISVNPGEQLAKARDATRERHVKALETALYAYMIKNGSYPEEITSSIETEICNTNVESPVCGDLIDLSSLSSYIPTLPINPGTSDEESGTGYHVTVVDEKIDVWPEESETGQVGTRVALEFDGVDDYTTLGEPTELDFQPTHSFSLGGWISVKKVNPKWLSWTEPPQWVNTTSVFFGRGSGPSSVGIGVYTYWINNGDPEVDPEFEKTIFIIGSRAGDYITYYSPSIDFNKFYYVFFIYTPGTQYTYINGELVNFKDNSSGFEGDFSGNWNIFRNRWVPGGNPAYMGGIANDVRIYNRALSAQEVEDLYNGQHIEEGLVGYWPMNEGQGCTVYDHSENENHGTLEPNCSGEEGPTWIID